MGLFSKLFKTGVAAGAGAVGVKVAEKVKESYPNGIGDVNSDGKVDYEDYLQAVSQAAKELYGENAPAAKEAAEKKIAELKEAHPEAADKINEVVETLKNQLK